jgi:hypothetical protein
VVRDREELRTTVLVSSGGRLLVSRGGRLYWYPGEDDLLICRGGRLYWYPGSATNCSVWEEEEEDKEKENKSIYSFFSSINTSKRVKRFLYRPGQALTVP